MAKATWEGAVLAESDDCVTVEGNLYFPPDAVEFDHLRSSSTTTVCPLKGVAYYYNIEVHGRPESRCGLALPGSEGRGKADQRIRSVLEGCEDRGLTEEE